jgi:hypothetical protein
MAVVLSMDRAPADRSFLRVWAAIEPIWMRGMMFRPAASISFANCLASASVKNVVVCLADDREESSRFLGISTETNQ